MTPICSCLIPSRGRPIKLADVISSIQSSDPTQLVEILVRIDDDDDRTLPFIPLLKRWGVRVVVGPRYKGYESHGVFYDELAKAASAPWVALFNDDTIIEGDDWVEQLRELPTHGLIVQPEFSKLGGSTYHRAEGQCVPFLPNGCWKQYGMDAIPFQPDTNLHKLLEGNGWKTHFLKGVTIHHQRASDEELAEHRKL